MWAFSYPALNASGAPRDSAAETAWSYLVANQPDAVVGLYAESPPVTARDEQMLGVAAMAEGDWEQATERWLRACEIEPSFPPVSMLRIAAERAGAGDSCIPFYERLLEHPGAVDPAVLTVVGDHLQRIAAERNESGRARELLDQLGVVHAGWTVAGPFGRFGSADLDEPFAPETQPGRLPYPGWLGEVWPVPGVTTLDGELRLTRFIDPDKGAGYAWTALEAAEGGTAHLTVETSDSVVVWLNGERVLRKAVLELDLAPSITVPVTLRPGVNTLRVKVLKQSGLWSFRLALRTPEGRACSVTPARTATLPPVALGGSLPERIAGDAVFDADNPVHTHVIRPWLAMAAGRYTAARESLQESLAAHPDFALIHRLSGETDLAEAAYRLGIDDFLNNRATRPFQAAADRLPSDAESQGLLLERLLSQSQTDAALERVRQLREEWPDTASRPSVLVQTIKIYREKRFLTEALSAAETLTRTRPPYAEGWRLRAEILDELGDPCSGLDVLREGLQWDRGERLILNRTVDALEKCGRLDDAVAILRERLTHHPDDLNRVYRLAELLAASGHAEEAQALLGEVLAIYPDLTRPRRLMLDLILAGQPPTAGSGAETAMSRPEILDAARTHLAVLLHKDPSDPRLQSLTRLLHGDPLRTAEAAPDFYASSLLRYEDLPDAVRDATATAASDSAFLLDSLVTRIHADGTTSEMTHYIVQLLKPEGREKWAEMDLPARDAEVLWARTILRDGTIFEAGAPTDLGERKVLSMVGLEPGCVIDLAYVQHRRGGRDPGRNGYEGTFYFGQTGDHVIHSRWLILAAPGISLDWAANPPDFQPVRSESPEGTAYLWERQDVPAARNESRRPPLEEIAPTVKVSTWTDWLRAVRVVQEHSAGRDSPDAILDEAADRIAAEARTPAERAAAVYAFVRESIEEGSGGETAGETLTLRKGSAFDRTHLARALLRRMGIAARIAWRAPRDPFARLPELPRPSRFASPLLYVPLASDGATPALAASWLSLAPNLWFDFSSRYLAPGELADPDSGPLALVDDGDGFHFEALQPQTLPGGWLRRDYAFRLLPGGDVVADGTLTYCGEFKRVVLERQTDRSTLDQLIDFQVTDAIPGIRAETRSLAADGALANPLLTFSGPVASFLTETESGRSFSLLPDRSRMGELIREPTRTLDFLGRGMLSYRPTRIVYVLDDPEWTWGEIPTDAVELTEFGAFSLTCRVNGNRLTVRRSIYAPPQRIAPDRYPAFADFCRRIDAAERRNVLLLQSAAVAP